MIGENIDIILEKLLEYSKYSNKIEILYNNTIYCPAISSVIPDDKLHIKRIIEINISMIPDDINIIAHILSHEWGHHVLDHVLDNPMELSKTELDTREDEADVYASAFIEFYQFKKEPIIDFILKTNPYNIYKNRINILNNNI